MPKPMESPEMQYSGEVRILKDLIREAHVAIKDLKAVQKEIRKAVSEAVEAQERLEAGWRLLAEDKMHEAVTEAIEAMNEELMEHMVNQYKHTEDSWTKITNKILFGNIQGRGESVIKMLDRRVGELFSEMSIITEAMTQLRADLAVAGKVVPDRDQTLNKLLRQRLDQHATNAWGKDWAKGGE